MDVEKSTPDALQRAGRDSTRSLTANKRNCLEVAAILLTDPEPILRSFEGEPLLEVLQLVIWALDKEAEDARFDPAIALPKWAERRGRGAWRQPRAAARVWYGNSAAEDAEIQEALDTNGYSTIRCRVENGHSSKPRSSWGIRFTNEQVQANLDRMEG